jgi:hypothetical protein
LVEIIPLFGIFMIIAVVIGPVWITQYFKARERAQLHETVRIAYEKGQPVPPDLVEALRDGPDEGVGLSTAERDFRRAIVLISVGLGLVCLGWGLWYGISFADETGGAIAGGVVAGSGGIPGLIGVAYLVLWLAKRGSVRA